VELMNAHHCDKKTHRVYKMTPILEDSKTLEIEMTCLGHYQECRCVHKNLRIRLFPKTLALGSELFSKNCYRTLQYCSTQYGVMMSFTKAHRVDARTPN
jgi:hypothetical protein